jgi:hypothetical protein
MSRTPKNKTSPVPQSSSGQSPNRGTRNTRSRLESAEKQSENENELEEDELNDFQYISQHINHVSNSSKSSSVHVSNPQALKTEIKELIVRLKQYFAEHVGDYIFVAPPTQHFSQFYVEGGDDYKDLIDTIVLKKLTGAFNYDYITNPENGFMVKKKELEKIWTAIGDLKTEMGELKTSIDEKFDKIFKKLGIED